MSQEILEKVCSIVSEQLSVEAGEVKSDSNFQNDLGADSLDTVELVMALEEAFDIEIPDDANKMTLTQALKAKKLYEETGDAREARKMSVRIQEKFTLPCACLVFGLIGSSLGAKQNLRTSKSQGFGLSVILILLYYVISFLSSSLGVKGVLTPLISAWLPVLTSFSGGLYLLKKAS